MASAAFVVSLLAVICVPSSALAASEATAYQLDQGHTGGTSDVHLSTPLKQRWTRTFRDGISYPLIADGKVIATYRNESDYGGTIVALDAADGRTVWSRSVGGTYYWSASTYQDGRVFVVDGNGLLRALSVDTGNTLWAAQLPDQYSFSSAPTVADGVVYVGGAGSGGTVYAVAADTGTVLWKTPVANGDQSSPAVDADRIYVSYACFNTYALDRRTGAQVWHPPSSCSGGGGRTPVLYRGRLYTRDRSSGRVLNAATGALLDAFAAGPAPAFHDGIGVYLSGTTLRGEDAATGSERWTTTGDGYLSSAPLIVNDEVFVGSSQGGLFAYGLRDGELRWRDESLRVEQPDEHNVSRPLTGLAAADGILVVPAGGNIVAYEAAAPETRIDYGPGGTETSARATFAFSSPDREATFECRMDAGVWRWCASPTTYSALAPGEHVFSVRAVDTAGRRDGSPATRAFTKRTPPRPPPGYLGPLIPFSAPGAGPAASTKPRDLRPPGLRSLGVKPKRVHRGRGIRATVRLTEGAMVKLAVVQSRRGRRWRFVSGAAKTTWLAAGRRGLRVPRVPHLRPGRYRARAVAVDLAGNKSAVKTARFTVKP